MLTSIDVKFISDSACLSASMRWRVFQFCKYSPYSRCRPWSCLLAVLAMFLANCLPIYSGCDNITSTYGRSDSLWRLLWNLYETSYPLFTELYWKLMPHCVGHIRCPTVGRCYCGFTIYFWWNDWNVLPFCIHYQNNLTSSPGLLG